jgi:hypothetical protein
MPETGQQPTREVPCHNGQLHRGDRRVPHDRGHDPDPDGQPVVAVSASVAVETPAAKKQSSMTHSSVNPSRSTFCA